MFLKTNIIILIVVSIFTPRTVLAENQYNAYQRIVLPGEYSCKEKASLDSDRNFRSAFKLSHAVIEFTFTSTDKSDSDNGFVNNKISGLRKENLKKINQSNEKFNDFFNKNLAPDDLRYHCYPTQYQDGIDQIIDILYMEHGWDRNIALLSLMQDKDGSTSSVMNRYGSNLDIYQVYFSESLNKYFSLGQINFKLINGLMP